MKIKFCNSSYLATDLVVIKDDRKFCFQILSGKVPGVRVITVQYHKDFRELIFVDKKNFASGEWKK